MLLAETGHGAVCPSAPHDDAPRISVRKYSVMWNEMHRTLPAGPNRADCKLTDAKGKIPNASLKREIIFYPATPTPPPHFTLLSHGKMNQCFALLVVLSSTASRIS